MYFWFGIASFALVTSIKSENCTTPNNEQANCISLYLCPVLVAAIVTQQNASIEFVRKSNCGGTALDPLVCCGSSSTYNLPEEAIFLSTDINVHNKDGLLPDRSYCGYQRADDYVKIGNNMAIFEIPWLAALRYQSGSKIRTLCSGSLISRRYVLTAAHCLQNKFNLTPVSVRLGEYHVKNKTDCAEIEGFYECSEPPKDFTIEKKILHPGFSVESRNNSVGLLRLNTTVSYSDYIRPICLPTLTTKFAEIGDVLTTSGWGTKRYEHSKQTDTKKKILTKLITNEECDDLQSDSFSRLVTANHFCTRDLGNNTELSCRGDDGAPVTFSFKNQWQQEGILVVAMGCDGSPDRHIKVSNYLDWIKKNMDP